MGDYLSEMLESRKLNSYQSELQALKSHDEVQRYYSYDKGYFKISTSGHGYLVVPKKDKNAKIAKKIVSYGYVGKLAYYLEEDCELPEFFSRIG